jgi:hypothetical protein
MDARCLLAFGTGGVIHLLLCVVVAHLTPAQAGKSHDGITADSDHHALPSSCYANRVAREGVQSRDRMADDG